MGGALVLLHNSHVPKYVNMKMKKIARIHDYVLLMYLMAILQTKIQFVNVIHTNIKCEKYFKLEKITQGNMCKFKSNKSLKQHKCDHAID